MKRIIALILIVLFSGCVTSSGTSRIVMDMSKKEVMERMKNQGELVNEQEDELVYECQDKKSKLPLIKTFIFYNDSLVIVKEQSK